MPGNPVKLSKVAEGPETRVPWVGEHTDEVLARRARPRRRRRIAGLRDAAASSPEPAVPPAVGASFDP